MERPETPIPYGCSITLMTCRLDFGSSKPHNKFSRVRSDQKFSIYGNGSSRQKLSLKHHKSPMPAASQSLLYKDSQQQNLCQISSVKAPIPNINEINRPQKRGKVNKNSINKQMTSRPDTNVRIDNKQNMGSLLIDNGTNTNLFTDQITLNQHSAFDVKERETAHTNYFSRRVHTEQSNHRSSFIPFAELSNRKVNTLVYRSQLVQPCYTTRVQPQQINQPSVVYNSTVVNNCRNLRHSVSIPHSNNQIMVHQQTSLTVPPLVSVSASNSNISIVPQRNPALKKSTYLQGKVRHPSDSSQRQNQPLSVKLSIQPQIQKLQLMNIKQYPVVPASMTESNEVHMRRLSSPRFPKKFNTLMDLNVKHIDSSCGSKTSSNHVSILASQETIKVSERQSNADQFTKMIKLMTLKSLPLNSQIWENRGQQFTMQGIRR